MTSELTVRMANRLAELGPATRELSAFLEVSGAPHESIFTIELAVEELVTNTIKYGFDDDESHEILLTIEVNENGATLVVRDDGREFNPLTADPPDFSIPAQERPVGGLGLHLVRSMMDELTYDRIKGQNIITARKSFT